jgi:hypothetical protein
MSNFLAIATVTATLSQVIQSAVEVDVFGARVTTIRPDNAGQNTAEAKVNVYLYQITSNTALRNIDLPTRRSDGSIMQRPQAAIDLHYLLTFYGDETNLIPQRLLGSAVRTLHSKPLLTRQQIRDTISSQAFSFLAESNLAEEIELVKFTPLPLSLEEMSKLWSVLFQTPYTLSTAYHGTVVIIEGDETPQQALPVQEPKIYVMPFRQPIIEKVEAQAIASQPSVDQPIVADSTLVLRGKQLQGDYTLVRIAGKEARPLTDNVSNTLISVQLPEGLQAGVQGVQVIQQLALGDPAAPHNGFESNVAPFVLHPKIIAIDSSQIQADSNGVFSGTIVIQLNPEVGSRQRVAVRLVNETPDAGQINSYLFLAASRTADSDTINVSINGVRAATYFVYVLVDGAESVLDKDKDRLTFA